MIELHWLVAKLLREPELENDVLARECGPAGGGDRNKWMSALTESRCKAGANLTEMGGPMQSPVTVGSRGGYGAFYCFTLKP